MPPPWSSSAACSEELLAQTVNPAVSLQLIPAAALATVVVDSTVQEKGVAHPTDSKLLDAAQGAGIERKQIFAKEGRLLRFKAGRYAHARQCRRMRRVIKRQSTVLGRLTREIERKANVYTSAAKGLLLKKGTAIDATLIAAPSSTKTAAASVTLRGTKPRRETNNGMDAPTP